MEQLLFAALLVEQGVLFLSFHFDDC